MNDDEKQYLVLTEDEALAAWGPSDAAEAGFPAVPPLLVYPSDAAAHEAAMRYFEG